MWLKRMFYHFKNSSHLLRFWYAYGGNPECVCRHQQDGSDARLVMGEIGMKYLDQYSFLFYSWNTTMYNFYFSFFFLRADFN